MAYKLTNNKTATYGEKSQSVGNLQTRLNTLNAGKAGYVPLKIDNMYGPLTKKALAFTNQGAGSTTTPDTNTQPTVGNMYNINGGGDNGLSQAETDLQNYYTGGNTSGDQQIRDMIMQRLQAEIDATNSIYNEKIRQARLTGQGRIGTSTAIQGRRGLLGSDFGAAITDATNTENNQIYAGVDAERGAAIQAILGKGNAEATQAIKDKNDAYEKGLTARVEHLKNAGARQATQEERAAQAIFDSGKDISEFDKQTLNNILSTFPDSPKEVGVLANFNKLKKAQEVEKAKATAEAEKIARDSQFNLSEGQARYDANGNIIASRGKTYAPKAGGSSTGGVGGTVNGIKISGVAQSYVDQINNGSIKLSDLPSLIPGVAGTSLRNEINMAITAQRGKISESGQRQIDDQIALIDDLLQKKSTGKQAAVGASVAKLIPYGKGSGLQPSRVSFETKAQQLAGILTLDNLGLLKGPLSDSDREFVQNLSTGLSLGMTEKEFDKRLNSIKLKLVAKSNNFEQPSTTSTPQGTTPMIGPDGKQYSVPNANVAAFIKAGGSKL